MISSPVQFLFAADAGIPNTVIHASTQKECSFQSAARLLCCGWLMSRQSIKAGVRGKRVSVRPYNMRTTVMDGLGATVGASFIRPNLHATLGATS